MPRTPAVTVPNSSALPSAYSAPIWNVSLPGLVTISTPKKPTTSAAHRAGPTGSFRNTTEASAANSGAEKLIAVALASGIMLNAISSRRLRGELRHAAQHMRARPPRVQHRQPRGRQGEGGEHDERDKHPAEQHFADRIGCDQPFRGGAREREDHAGGDHEQDRLRNPLLPCRRRRGRAVRRCCCWRSRQACDRFKGGMAGRSMPAPERAAQNSEYQAWRRHGGPYLAEGRARPSRCRGDCRVQRYPNPKNQGPGIERSYAISLKF